VETTLLTDNNGVRTFDSLILRSHEFRISEVFVGNSKTVVIYYAILYI
jgi:hypothetical protein